MREFDDNSHSYGPVLRRIAILAAVIIMVPVMLWTITSFMRTYVAQPVIASPKPLLLAPATTASIDTGNAGTFTGSAPAQTGSIAAPGATANDSNPPSPAAKVASLANSDMPSPIPASATPQPNNTAASGPWPDPNQAIGGQQMSAPDTATATNDDVLPPSAPLKGPIPLPPHRPAVIAMATP
jgi:hypothetical protein